MSNLIAGRFEVLQTVGHGAQGEVLLARDCRHDRLVALKIRRVEPARPETRELVLGETRALLAMAPHPGAVVVRNDFFEGDNHVMVMDWVPGTSLAQLLNDQGDPGLPPSTVLAYIEQVASALDHLHGHEPPIVHGDVKPANLIVTARDRAVLVDFGIATGAGAFSGARTPGYMAPEVAAGQPPTPAADVYGLAATAFALLTGSPPTGVRPGWDGLDPSTVPLLERALRRALALDPARRPRTAGALVERLRGWRGADLPTGVVTFCLTDVEGSTSLWEQHPVAMARVLARHDALVAHAVEEHGGRLIKSQGEGDSTLSVFEGASQAVAAARAIHDALARERWDDDLAIPVRIAVHTGEAQLRGGDYYGTTLNRAARLRALAQGDQILLSGTTAALIAADVPDRTGLVDLGHRKLRGLTRPEHVVELTLDGITRGLRVGDETAHSNRNVVAATDATATDPRPLFGRRAELAELHRTLDSAIDGRGAVVLIGGETGIGKTRLLEALASTATGRSVDVTWGRCYEGEGAPAFWPWVRNLEHLMRQPDTAAVLAQLGDRAAHVSNLVPGFAPPPDLGSVAEPKEARFRQFDAIARFLIAAARHRPRVLMFEDLHWADTSTVLLLQFVAREITAAPLLLACTYRDVELTREHPLFGAVGELARSPSTRRIELRGLHRDDIATFVADRTGAYVAENVVDAVVSQTEGNPFFISELLHLVSDGGVAIHDLGHTSVPFGIQGVIGRRLDRLSRATHDTLRVASVIGRDFELRVLESIVGGPVEQMGEALDEARSARLVTELAGSPLRYRFAHALIRQTLYEERGATARARIHLRIAEALEAIDADGRVGELAYHYAQAARLEPSARAADYLRRAGDDALSVLAYEDAADHYEHAAAILEQLPTPDEALHARVLVCLADAQLRCRRADARETFRSAAARAQRGADPDTQARAALGYALLSPLQTVDWAAVDLLRSALEALPDGDHALRARVMTLIAYMMFHSQDSDLVGRLTADAVAMARRIGDPAVLAETLWFRHGALRGPGMVPARRAIADELISLGQRTGVVEHQLRGELTLLVNLFASGDMHGVDDTMTRINQLVERSRGGAHSLLHHVAMKNLPWDEFDSRYAAVRALVEGDLERAEVLAAEWMRVAQEIGDPSAASHYAIFLFGLRREQGRAAELEPGVRMFSQQYPDSPAWRCGLLALLVDQGRVDEATELMDTLAADGFGLLPTNDLQQVCLALVADACATLAQDQHAATLMAMLSPYAGEGIVVFGTDCFGSAARGVGVLATILKRYDDAEAYLGRALDFNTGLRSARWVAHTQIDFARMYRGRGAPGDDIKASDMLAAARRTAAELGLVRVARRADAIDRA